MLKPSTRKKDNKNTQPSSTLHKLLIWGVNLFLLGGIFVCGYVGYIYLKMPSLDAILHETRPAAIVFLDSDGNEIRSANRIMGTPVSVDTLPPHVWQAIIAIEDKRFFKHGPIDIRGLSRAFFSNIIKGRMASGGSTITQQTAKNIFLSRKKKISRKVQELILSHWLENRFNKNQILDLYTFKNSNCFAFSDTYNSFFVRRCTTRFTTKSFHFSKNIHCCTTNNFYIKQSFYSFFNFCFHHV